MNAIIKPELSPALLSEFHFTLGRINTIKTRSLDLKVDGVKDFKGLKKVVKTRKLIKKLRLATDTDRREMNKDLLHQMRMNNYHAGFIKSELLPIEKHLFSIEKDIAQQKLDIKLEKKRKALEVLQQRMEALIPFDIVPDIKELEAMTDKQFDAYLIEVRKEWGTRQLQKQQEAESLTNKLTQLEQENAQLKAAIPAPETVTVTLADPVKLTTDIPAAYMAMTTDEKATVHQQLKDYVTAIRAVAIPKIKNDQARIIFLHGHSLVNDGCNYILDAIK